MSIEYDKEGKESTFSQVELMPVVQSPLVNPSMSMSDLLASAQSSFSPTLLPDAPTIRPTIQDNLGVQILSDGKYQSPNYSLGLVGWNIDSDGNAEFNQGTFRGKFVLGGVIITINKITDLQSSINLVSAQGGGTVNLEPGTYTATTSFTIPSNVSFNLNSATIDFNGGAYQILIQGSSAYSTGTITATFGSKNIVGVGTTWTAAMVGQSILIGDFWYVIASRTDNTHIALATNFIGTNLSGDTYVIATTIDNPSIMNGTLTNSSIKLLEIRYVNTMVIDSLICDTGTYGIYMRDSGSVRWSNSTIGNCSAGGFYGNNIPFSNLNDYFVYNITGTGIELIRDTNAAFNTGSLQAITGVAVRMTNCVNMDFAIFSIIQCTSHGVEFVSGNGGVDIIDGYINTTGGDGIKLTASNTGIQVITTSIYNTTGYGVNNAASSNNNITIGINYYSSCASGNINDAGTNTSIIADDTAYGASWNGNLGTPTKNAIYDKIETMTPTPVTDVQIFTANGTWTKPTGAKWVYVCVIGGGGSGGGGDNEAAPAARPGGSGGGGGVYTEKSFRASDLAGTVAITVGAAATGGANHADGNAGATSSFGAFLSAFGGGGGHGANSNTTFSGGGGGGTAAVGQTGQETAGSTGGSPATAVGAAGISGQGAGGVTNAAGQSAEFGGGAGGGTNGGVAGKAGGSSLWGGGGGGAGGASDAGTGAFNGGAGGQWNSYAAGGGGTGGTTDGGAGSPGTSRSGFGCGDGGGGGQNKVTSGTGGTGGAGGAPGGGGGGGGQGRTTGGTGGAGGIGEVRVITYF